MTYLCHRFRISWPIVAFVGCIFLGTAGCKHRCCVSDRFREPRPFLPSAPSSPFLLPPANVPTTPAPPPPAAGSLVPPPVAPPPETRQYPSAPTPGWLAPPVTATPTPPPSNRPPPEILLPESLPPASNGSSSSARPPTPARSGEPSPSSVASPPTSSHLPGYTRVKRGVATGRRPTLDGFDALQRAGFRTLVYLHAPQADFTDIRQIAHSRQLDVIPLEVTPENLPQTAEQFHAIVADTSRHPLYVFDEDGVRAGVLWYLHFRTIDALNDDAARIRARPLGFLEQGNEATPWLLAIQRYLSQR